jgi:DNA-binding beta-propeller fold protein YncE
VVRYDLASGDFVDSFIVVERPDPRFGSRYSPPIDVQISPDGWVYVLTANPREVWSYIRANGTFAGVVVPNLNTSATQALGMAFGPDKNLYLSAMDFTGAASILRFDGKTGAPLGLFVQPGIGGLPRDNNTCIAFGPDGNLYVAGNQIAGILRFNGSTGAFIDTFVASHPYSNDLNPRGLAFDSNGDLYALAAPATQPGGPPSFPEPNRILRYNGVTGFSMGEFVSPGDQLGQPRAIAFGPDGNLYVATRKPLIRFGPRIIGAQILVFDGATGGFIRALDSPNRAGLAGLTYPISMAFAVIPISIRDDNLLSRLPQWIWPLGLGFIAGAIAGRITSR